MNKRLMDYLDKKGAKPLEEDFLAAYARSMTEVTIPEAEKQVRRNRERVAQLKFLPWVRHWSGK